MTPTSTSPLDPSAARTTSAVDDLTDDQLRVLADWASTGVSSIFGYATDALSWRLAEVGEARWRMARAGSAVGWRVMVGRVGEAAARRLLLDAVARRLAVDAAALGPSFLTDGQGWVVCDAAGTRWRVVSGPGWAEDESAAAVWGADLRDAVARAVAHLSSRVTPKVG